MHINAAIISRHRTAITLPRGRNADTSFERLYPEDQQHRNSDELSAAAFLAHWETKGWNDIAASS